MPVANSNRQETLPDARRGSGLRRSEAKEDANMVCVCDSRPFFAGIWTRWHGKRGTKANPIEGGHQLLRNEKAPAYTRIEDGTF